MLHKILRKIRTVLRYLFPTAQDRAYLARIRESGLFDRAFYLQSNAGLNRLFHIWPERHYVQLGERIGTCPNPGFSPRAYLFHNPDLAQETHPFLHYIDKGRAEHRMVLAPSSPDAVPVLPVITPRKGRAAPVAVVVHAFYPDFWDEIAPLLAAQGFDFDLFVTLTKRDGTEALRARVLKAFPDAQVWLMPNHGRDILPFVHLVNSGVLAPYAAVCKLHSKKSPHRSDGDAWRKALVAGVLGDAGPTSARLEQFLALPGAGFWTAEGQRYEGDHWWGVNRPRAEALMTRAGLTPPAGPLVFPAGSIYWIKPPVLQALAALGLEAADFEPEQALVDGTTAHSVERMMGWLAAQAGQEILTAGDLAALADGQSAPVEA